MKNILASGGKLHWMKNLYLRLRYGGGCCDIFSLNHYLAKQIVRPLKEFRNNTFSYSSDFKSCEEWKKAIDEMIWSFEFLLRDEDWDKNISSDERTKLFEKEQKGFDLFGKYFRELWI